MIARIEVGGQPIAVAGGGGTIWVANAAGTVSRIEPDTNAVLGEPIPVGGRPQSVAFGDGAAWVANQSTLVRIES